MIRILLVEDDPTHGPFLLEELTSALKEVKLHHAQSRDAAIAAFANGPWDLILCDLKIPAEDGGLDAAVEHGLAVRSEAQRISPGTPVIIQSAFNTVEIAQQLMLAASKEDIYGSGAAEPMLTFFKKTALDKCVGAAARHADEITRLSQIEVNGVDSSQARRVLRVFASRHKGDLVRVSPIGGGLSGARVMRVEVFRAGAPVARVLARVADKDDADREIEGYDRFVAPMLPAGSFSPRMALTITAPGRDVGLFYTLIGSGDRSLLDVLRQDSDAAAKVVEQLATAVVAWPNGGANRAISVEDVRRTFISDEDFERVKGLLGGAELAEIEAKMIQVRWCPEHRDLHGVNVLIENGRPILIDFGDVGDAPGAVDPITLELSIHFHPKGVKCEGDWRELILGGGWWSGDLRRAGDLYPYVAACRAWASQRAADRERLACAYGYAIRQLKYGDTDHDLAVAIARSAMNGLLATF